MTVWSSLLPSWRSAEECPHEPHGCIGLCMCLCLCIINILVWYQSSCVEKEQNSEAAVAQHRKINVVFCLVLRKLPWQWSEASKETLWKGKVFCLCGFAKSLFKGRSLLYRTNVYLSRYYQNCTHSLLRKKDTSLKPNQMHANYSHVHLTPARSILERALTDLTVHFDNAWDR